jgi:hypothetical protein
MAAKPHISGPAFIGIGAQKAGTTWLYAQLCQHPNIWMPPVKELHYFDRSPRYNSPSGLDASSPLLRFIGRDPFHRRQSTKVLRSITGNIVSGNYGILKWSLRWFFGSCDDHWYQSLFDHGNPEIVSGEITPSYSILNAEDIERMKQLCPSAKIVLLVREPVERAWSAMRFYKRIGRFRGELDSVSDVLAVLSQEEHRRRGDYASILEDFTRFFNPRQILICFYDCIETKPKQLLADIYSFLGVACISGDKRQLSTRRNVSPSHEMPSEIRDWLVDTYKPSIEFLATKYGGYFTHWLENLGREHPRPKHCSYLPAAINP